jgi:sulfite reductase alpha subunit-like flavoprotein
LMSSTLLPKSPRVHGNGVAHVTVALEATPLPGMASREFRGMSSRRVGVAMAEAALFNGIRSASQDFIYKDEVEQFTADGVFDHVHIAGSRERTGRRDYVQDRLREQGALLWRLLSAGGYVYVCGSQPMREAVRTAVADVVASYGSLPPAEAETYLRDMETTARYRPDLWV